MSCGVGRRCVLDLALWWPRSGIAVAPSLGTSICHWVWPLKKKKKPNKPKHLLVQLSFIFVILLSNKGLKMLSVFTVFNSSIPPPFCLGSCYGKPGLLQPVVNSQSPSCLTHEQPLSRQFFPDIIFLNQASRIPHFFSFAAPSPASPF